MVKSCALVVRVFMIIFNVLFVLIGLAIMGTALFLYFKTYGLHGIAEPRALAYIFIGLAIIGAVCMALGLFGCCGAYHYSQCLLGLYFAILLLLFAAQVPIAVVGFLDREMVRELIDQAIKAAVDDHKKNPNGAQAMDFIQVAFECCGYNGFVDYTLSVPKSCCKGACSLIPSYYEPCKNKVNEFLQSWVYICAALICIAAVQLFGLICSMILCCAVRTRDDGYQQGMTI